MATPSRRCAARAPLISTAFLIALGRMQGSGAGTNLAPSASSACANRIGAVSGSSRTLRLRLAERLELLRQRRGLGDIEQTRASSPLHIVADLGGVDEQSRPTARRHDGVSERDGRVSDIAAADVEQPGDRIQHGEQHGVDFLVLEQRLHVADLVLVRFAPHIRARAARSARSRPSAAPATGGRSS